MRWHRAIPIDRSTSTIRRSENKDHDGAKGKHGVDNASNGFYRHMNGTLKGVAVGRKRPLNLWVWE